MTAKWDYWNGPDDVDRREKYARVFKPEYQVNGDGVQQKIAAVVTAFRSETQVELPEGYSSGWRPPVVNDRTANSAKGTSKHLTAQAGDKRDTDNGDFAWWCFRNPHILEIHGLWIEHPVSTVVRSWKLATKTDDDPDPWCHLQSEPPGSGLRIYFPDHTAPKEWEEFLASGGQPGMAYEAWKALGKRKRKEATEDE